MTDKLVVCGAGTMGAGIAQAAAQSGIDTILYELNEAVLQQAQQTILKSIDGLIAKGKLTADAGAQVRKRVLFTASMEECVAPVIIEAIVEKPATKIELFNKLASLNARDTILASNTSSLSIKAIAEQIGHPERVIGMHFFNPATIMKLVEVVTTPFVAQSTIDTILALAKQMNKTPVLCTDAPGFIVNRVARPYYIESLRQAEELGIDIEQVDRLLEASGFKMGPFKLMDLIGNDINYAVSCSVYEQLGQPGRLKPSFVQQEKVTGGKLGRKTGTGFYSY